MLLNPWAFAFFINEHFNFAELLKKACHFTKKVYSSASQVTYINIQRRLKIDSKLSRKLLASSARKVTDLYHMQETFPKHRTSMTPEAASLITSLHPTHTASLSHSQRKLQMKCEVLCQKLRDRTQSYLQKDISYQRIHCKSNGLLL